MSENYYTFEGKCVNDRIEDGRTKIFRSELDAQKFAREKKSYHYPLYDSPSFRRKLIAYGVPK